MMLARVSCTTLERSRYRGDLDMREPRRLGVDEVRPQPALGCVPPAFALPGGGHHSVLMPLHGRHRVRRSVGGGIEVTTSHGLLSVSSPSSELLVSEDSARSKLPPFQMSHTTAWVTRKMNEVET